jgi:hypothetical protein
MSRIEKLTRAASQRPRLGQTRPGVPDLSERAYMQWSFHRLKEERLERRTMVRSKSDAALLTP